MNPSEKIMQLLEENDGFLKTSDVLSWGISKPTLMKFIQDNQLQRVAQGLYMSDEAWADPFFILQTRYQRAVFSHETALFLLEASIRTPEPISMTLATGSGTTRLKKEGVRVYTVKEELFLIGQIEIETPYGKKVKVYNMERTLCDLLRSRRKIEIQELQSAIKAYVEDSKKDIPLLLHYARLFSVEKHIKHYLEVLLPS